jgi:hypothetical protein
MYAPPIALVVVEVEEADVGAFTLLNFVKNPVIVRCCFGLYIFGASTTINLLI